MFTKTYWFSSSKGMFRLVVSSEARDVRIEVEPSKFVSVKDLWLTKTIGLKKKEEIENAKAKHFAEYEEMIDTLSGYVNVEAQDYYIILEMKSQGYNLMRR